MDFEKLYSEHKNLVYNLALQYTQNVEDAEEITQDVFVKVHEKQSTFKKQADIKTWIYRITVNKSLDFLKARKSKKRWTFNHLFRVDDDAKEADKPNFNHPGVELEQREATERIFKAINQLPENQKTALILLKIENLSLQEISVIMNITPKAVESCFHRAKKNLNILLNKTEEK